jgi:hypothetical protein
MSYLNNTKLAGAAAAVTLLVATTVWVMSGPAALAEMTVERDAGRVQVLRGDQTLVVDGSFELEPNDVVVTKSASAARLRLEGDRELALGARSQMRVMDGDTVEARAGRLLAGVKDPTKVMVGRAFVASSNGRFRIDRLYGSARAGVYRGRVRVEAPGSPGIRLSSLYQTSVTSDQVLSPRPYQLNDDDEWDRLLLGEIVDLDQSLERLGSTFAAQLGQDRPGLSYFGSLTKKDVGFMRAYVSKQSRRTPGYTADLLVGFTIARHAPGPTDRAFERGFSLFEDGARWGIAAGLLGLRAPGFRDVKVALEETILGTGVVAGGTGGDAEFVAAEEGGSGASEGGGAPDTASGSGGAAPSGSAGGASDGGASGGTPQSSEPGSGGGGGGSSGGDEDEPESECGDVIECTAEDVVPSPFLDPQHTP